MSRSLATRARGDAPHHAPRSRRPLVALLLLGLVGLALLAPRLALPAKVPPLTIENAGAYTVIVEASDRSDSGWTPVAIVRAGKTVVAREVIDVGPNWNVRFISQGHELGGYEVRRSDLAAAGWRYSVPDDVINRLRDQGAPPSA